MKQEHVIKLMWSCANVAMQTQAVVLDASLVQLICMQVFNSCRKDPAILSVCMLCPSLSMCAKLDLQLAIKDHHIMLVQTQPMMGMCLVSSTA